MRKIAIINQKGGVGKTTTAVNLASALARLGNSVHLIDLDPQAHASLHVGVTVPPGKPTVYDVLCGDAMLADAHYEVSENLSVIPANLDLAAAELELAGEVGREVILRDKLAIDNIRSDYLIVDCPPSLGVLTLNALTAVDEVFLPLQPHFLALHGLSKLLRTIEVVAKRLNPKLRLSGVVLCMYDASTRLAIEVSRDVQEFFQAHSAHQGVWAGAKFFETRIRRNIRLAEAPSFGQSIFDYAPSSNGAEDYMALALETVDSSKIPADLTESVPIRHKNFSNAA